jgi:hypothetical protein
VDPFWTGVWGYLLGYVSCHMVMLALGHLSAREAAGDAQARRLDEARANAGGATVPRSHSGVRCVGDGAAEVGEGQRHG